MKIFFSVGEPSGDLHGANLIRDLRGIDSAVECVGYGGPKMAAAGCRLHEDLTQFAIMWVVKVLLNLHKFWRLLRRADQYFREHPVDAVVLIDYPGFNWWLARKAKKHNIPVFYYGAPQMWGWGGWRVKKMRRLVDHVLCKLPFETEWYRERGCRATYVGHPYFDELVRQRLDDDFLNAYANDARPLVTILPGSRTQEVAKNLGSFLRAAEIVRANVPDVRFAIASFNDKQAATARVQCLCRGLDADVFVGRTPELIHLATCCMACSGSVSLELLYREKPTVILYVITRTWWLAQAILRKVKYITLVNLLYTDKIAATSRRVYDPDEPGAEQAPFPEYFTTRDKSQQIARHIELWLTDDQRREARIVQLQELKRTVCQPGASQYAARFITAELANRRHLTRRAARAA